MELWQIHVHGPSYKSHNKPLTPGGLTCMVLWCTAMAGTYIFTVCLELGNAPDLAEIQGDI